MKNVYYIQYEVRPAPKSEEFDHVGGAFVNCLIAADSESGVLKAAQRNFQENKWVVVSIEEGPFIVVRELYADNPEWLAYFDQATTKCECYIFNQWPPEQQEEDVVH